MGMKVCPRGHKYNELLDECPYCPRPKTAASVLSRNSPSEKKTRIATGFIEQTENDKISVQKTRMVVNPKRYNRTQLSETTGDGRLIGWLVTYSWNSLGDDYRLREGKTHIGTDPTQDVCVKKDALVSSRHATLLFRDGVLRIKDDFSTNGTMVNGEEIGSKSRVLNDGDTIKVGRTVFELRLIRGVQLDS